MTSFSKEEQYMIQVWYMEIETEPVVGQHHGRNYSWCDFQEYLACNVENTKYTNIYGQDSTLTSIRMH